MAKYKRLKDNSYGLKIDEIYDESKQLVGNHFVKDSVRESPHLWKQVDGKNIVGYKLIKNSTAIRGAIKSITGNVNFDFNQFKNRGMLEAAYAVMKLESAGVLNIWFDPVCKTTFKLPIINGHNGQLLSGSNATDKYHRTLKYGCAILSVRMLKHYYNASKEYYSGADGAGNRTTNGIILKSGIQISFDQIKQIIDYINSL